MSRRPSAFATRATGQNERGATLVVCVILLFVLMAAVSTTVSMALFRQSAAKRAKEADRAYVLAEAGADRALYELQVDADVGNEGIGVAAGEFGGGSFEAVLDPPFAGPGADGPLVLDVLNDAVRESIETTLRLALPERPRLLGIELRVFRDVDGQREAIVVEDFGMTREFSALFDRLMEETPPICLPAASGPNVRGVVRLPRLPTFVVEDS